MTRTKSTCCCLVAVLLCGTGACALPPSAIEPPGMPSLRVQVANDGPDIVSLTFVSHGGYRSRIGTVPPLSTESFSPRVNVNAAGYFVVRRASDTGTSVIRGEYDPQLLAGERVRIRIGEQSVGDYWLIDKHNRVRP